MNRNNLINEINSLKESIQWYESHPSKCSYEAILGYQLRILELMEKMLDGLQFDICVK